ncbi:MAG: ATP-dependent DNA helicase, partial [Bacteroidia bacterium]|nr:ATP-dependent DNA helicase [Bacteroidia bacterium]
VFVSGLEENLFPSQMSLGSRSDLEEERRLFYVAITRAEESLTLSFATSRFRFGTLLPSEPSRFIDEIDNEYLQMERKNVRQNTNPLRHLERKSTNTTPSNSLKKTIERQKRPSMLRPPAITDFEAEDMQGISEGMQVEHQRFGKGKVTKLEGKNGPEKATIDFLEFGEKTLVLKFAKLRRV